MISKLRRKIFLLIQISLSIILLGVIVIFASLSYKNTITDEDSESIFEQFDKMLISYINEKIKEGNNVKILEEYYDYRQSLKEWAIFSCKK